MKIGVHLGNNGLSASAESTTRLAVGAEALGFDSAWVSDHVAIPTAITSTYPYGPPGSFSPEQTQNFWEAFAVLAFVAGQTTRLELGTSVIVLPQRPPLLVAKQWATLDALSGGRCILGIGAGWMREEFEALGFGEQFDRRGVALDEAIRILRAAWTLDGPIEHHGQAYDFGPVLMQPKPVRPGGLPIWIGGHGKRSIRRAAELGNGWQPLRVSVEELSGHLGYLDEQLSRYGRSRNAVTISLGVLAHPPGTGPADGGSDSELAGDPDACAEKLRRYQALGVEHLMLSCPRGTSAAGMLEAYAFVAQEIRPRSPPWLDSGRNTDVRVIAGSARGRPLRAPDLAPTRPTADKIKGAIFSMLDAEALRRGIEPVEDSEEQDGRFAAAVAWPRVLELYAGSGALAIEALSRGATHADLVESNADARKAIAANLEKTGLADRATVHRMRSESAVSTFHGPYDLILLDPPYDAEGVQQVLERLAGGDLLDDSGVVIWEHSASTVPPEHLEGPSQQRGLRLLRTRKHGAASVSLYAAKAASST